MDISRGVEWSRWWTGGAFNYAVAASTRAPSASPTAWRSPGRARTARSADSPTPSSRPRSTWRRACSQAWAWARATVSASSCRSWSRRWSRCSPSVVCARSTRRSSPATRRLPSPAASTTARRGCSSPPMASAAAAGSFRLKAIADEAVAATPSVERVLVVRRLGETAPEPVPWAEGRDRWWDEAMADPSVVPLTDAPETDPETPYMVIYTSGTTGPAEGRRPRPRRLPHQGRAGPGALLRPRPRRHAVLVHRPRLDDGSLGDLRVRCCSARRWCSTRACRTSPRRIGCGRSSSATA